MLAAAAAVPEGWSTDDLEGGSMWMPNPASTFAGSIDGVFNFIYWICLIFFALIVAMMVYFCVKYRRREEGQKAEVQITHNTSLELTWTIIPLLLSVVIFYVGLEGYVQMRQAPANAYEVQVTGQKWNWTFTHRNGAQDVQVLKVPAGRPVKLTMTSTDVLHSVYIPAFRVKQDVVPGRYSSLWFQADEPGTYQLFCTEYCGTSHSQMAAIVSVLEEDEFERQIAEDAAWLDKVDATNALAMAEAGYRLYARCASCHSVNLDEPGSAPTFWDTHDMWEAGTPRQMADGSSVAIDENYIKTSILYPGEHVVAGYVDQMPSFRGQLDEKAIQAIFTFIRDMDDLLNRDGSLKAGG
ncbi:MAG: cytochrome c oxidase subunit II [Phycisphaerales bacterium]